MTGDAIFNGLGAGQPKGIVGAASTISVAKESGQAAATFTKQNANKMWARLHPASRLNSAWFYNVNVEPQFDEFYTAVTNVAGTENVGGFGSNIYSAENNTLKSRPLIPCEFASTLGTVGDVVLADMKGYVTGVRMLRSAVSMHVRFEYAEKAFRFIFAIDGQPWLAAPTTPYKGSGTVSTAVTLDTRS